MMVLRKSYSCNQLSIDHMYYHCSYSYVNKGCGLWEKIQSKGDSPSSLQEHTMLSWKDNIYIFGGEVGFAAADDVPLWIYNIKVSCNYLGNVQVGKYEKL